MINYLIGLLLLCLTLNTQANTTEYKLIYEIESTSGTDIYRPGDDSCNNNPRACGYHQLTPNALTELGYGHKNYWILRSNYNWSKARALEYLKWLDKHFPGKTMVFKYLRYNQGGHGATQIYRVAQGKRDNLPKDVRNNIFSNLPSKEQAEWRSLSDKRLSQNFIKHYTKVVKSKLRKIK